MKTRNLIFLIIITLAGLFTSAVAAPSVSVTLEPKTIPLNETARFTVNIKNGERNAVPQLAEIDNLTFIPTGQSSQIRIVNGDMTSVISYSYQITTTKEGQYQIPAVTVQSGGQQYNSNSLKLTVTAPQKNPAQSPLQQGDQLSDEEKKKTAFLTINRADNKGREHLYVGESTPVMIRVYLRSGLRVRALNKPSVSSEAFTLSALSDEPEQSTEVLEGIRYHVFSWYGNLSGIKAGDYDLTTELKATLSVPSKRPTNRSRSNDPFDDPFFDSFFTQYESRDITLTSDQKKTKVITPPLKGRPDSFTGAVGQYKIKASSLPSSLETGEATTLKVSIEGKGNFDRVDKPTLMPSKTWKTYKAKTDLERGDIVDFHARKNFTVPAVATEPGEFETFFQFSFFDPETEEYKTIETAKHKIKVSGKAVSMTAPLITAKETPVTIDEQSLPVIKESIGSLFAATPELYQKPWFKGLISMLILVILGCLIVSFLQQHQNKHPEAYSRRKLSRETKRQLSSIEANTEKGEALTFFRECRLVLQNQIAQETGGQAEAITLNNVLEKFPTCKAAIEVFKKADEIEFAALEESQESMDEWLNKTRVALEEIQTPPAFIKQQNESAWGQVASSV